MGERGCGCLVNRGACGEAGRCAGVRAPAARPRGLSASARVPASPGLQPGGITLKKCSHMVYLTLSGANSEMCVFTVQVEILISHKFPTNCCSTFVFVESVRAVYGTEAWPPCLWAVAAATQAAGAQEERPFPEVLWKALDGCWCEAELWSLR